MIEAMILLARLLLALVFIAAGVAKLLDRSRGREAIAAFGVPARLVVPLAVLLPIAECAIALGMFVASTAWLASLAALLLLASFMAAISLNLARGRTPDCHCFGQLHSAPIGRGTLLRVGALAVVAAFLTATARTSPGASVVAGFADLPWSEDLAALALLGLLLLSVAQAAMTYQLMMQQGRLLVRLERIENQRAIPIAPASGAELPLLKNHEPKQNPGLPVGAPAPAFELVDLEASKLSSSDLLAEGKPLLLVFTNPKCGPCAALTPEIAHWAMEPDMPARIVMVSEGAIADNLLKFPLSGDPLVLVQTGREVAEAYKANGTPAAVVVRANGTIGSALALGADDIRELVGSLAAEPHIHLAEPDAASAETVRSRQLAVGESVGALSLLDAKGDVVPLGRFAGAATLLLFWNPQCGFCQRMSQDLYAWASSTQAGSPRIVIVWMGAADRVDDMGPRLPVMTDPGSLVSNALGAHGTPMGVLLGADNRIAAPVAAGADAVFALVGRQDEMAA